MSSIFDITTYISVRLVDHDSHMLYYWNFLVMIKMMNCDCLTHLDVIGLLAQVYSIDGDQSPPGPLPYFATVDDS